MYKIQNIYLGPIVGDESLSQLYYRGNDRLDFINVEDGGSRILKGSFFETFTYYGSLSAEKWFKYTYAYRFYLVLKAKGIFTLTLFGHYVENNQIKKEYFGKYKYELKESTEITIPYPSSFRSQVVAFSLESESDTVIYYSCYSADLEKTINNNPNISLITTTFKKEDFIRKNILLLKNDLFSDKEFEEAFCWIIVDNGRTLEKCNDKNITILHNSNVGGAGGFARGMIEALKTESKPTHVLLMDDDVIVSPESFKRLYKLLCILRPQYTDYFISGAMLNADIPFIQHENTGRISEKGYCVPVNTGMDLRIWDQVLLNETIDDNIEKGYAAWWFCCIPTTIVNENNLPLPVFVRCDDMEYSIRNHARFITMNGISIWHERFARKANPVMDFYQSKRNELIIHAIREELADVETIQFIDELFWQEMYKFNYYAAQLLLDAIEDYLKGPEWFFNTNLYEIIKSKKNIVYDTKIISDDVRSMIDYDQLYKNTKVTGIIKFIYDYTYNGQARIPNFMFSKKKGVIPYGGGYYPCNQLLTDSNIAVDTVNDKYIEYRKDRKKFNEIKNNYLLIKKQYIEKNDEIVKQYREFAPKTITVKFWQSYISKYDSLNK